MSDVDQNLTFSVMYHQNGKDIDGGKKMVILNISTCQREHKR